VSAAAQDKATRLVARYLQGAKRAAFDAVLRVAAEFGVSVPLGMAEGAADAFVTHWADDPTAGYDPSAWPPDPPIGDMLMHKLTSRIADGTESAQDIGDRWWRNLPLWTPGQANINLPLQRALLSAAMLHSDFRDRFRIVQAMLRHHPYPAEDDYHRKTVDTLWARTPATTEELRELCRLVPVGTMLNPATFASLVASANADPAGLPELELCGELSNRGLMVLDRATTVLLALHRKLQHFESDPPAETLARRRELLLQAPPNLLYAHAEPLAHAMLAIHDAAWLVNLGGDLPPPVASAYLRAVCAQPRSWRPEQVAVLFALPPHLDPWWLMVDPERSLRYTIDDNISYWCRRASKNDIRDVAQCLEPLGTEAVDSWNNLAKHARASYRRSRGT
jgi:hypothetical protein